MSVSIVPLSDPGETTQDYFPGNTPDDIFDVSKGVVVVSHTPVHFGYDIRDMFGGHVFNNVLGSMDFEDRGPRQVDTVFFTTPSPVNVAGYHLYLYSRNSVAGQKRREVTTFQLLADGNTVSTVNIIPVGGSYTASYGSQFIEVTDTFAPVTARSFEIIITANNGVEFPGPQIIEFDGIGSPTDIAMQSAQLQAGNTVQFTYQTTGNPGPFQVGLYRSADGTTFNPADLIGSLQTVTPSPTNPQTPGALSLPNPLPSDPSKPALLVVADPNNAISESNENNNAVSLLPDLRISDLLIRDSGIGLHYTVTGGALSAGTKIAFFWSSGPSLAEQLGVAADPIDILAGTGVGTYPDGVLTARIKPGPLGTTHLVAVIDPNNSIRESDETNNVQAIPVTPAPTVKLLLPETANMRETYELRVSVTNNATIPITVNLNWKEFFLDVPAPVGTAGEDKTPPINLAPVETQTISLHSFKHTWEWIPRKNPLETLDKTLKDIIQTMKGSIAEGLEQLLKPGGKIVGNLTKILGLIDFAGTLIEPKRTSSVRYVATVDWGQSTFSVREDVKLKVPLDKQSWQLAYAATNLLAGEATGAGFASLFIGGLPASLLSFAAEVGILATSELLYHEALDPPDPNFKQIVTPHSLAVPEVDALPDSLLKQYAQNIFSLYSLQSAEATSRDRAIGAADANDALWESAQLVAVADYAAMAAEAQTRLVGIHALLEPYIRQVIAPHADAIVPALESQGLPDLEVRYLTQLGWTPDRIEALRRNLIQVGPDLVQNPAVGTAAFQVTALVSANSAVEALTEAIDLRVGQLGQAVESLSADQRHGLDVERAIIDSGLASGTRSVSLLTGIETYLADVRHFLDATNNLAALQGDLDFGFISLAEFQQLEVTPTAPPVPGGVNPNAGPPGAVVQLWGTGFQAGSQVFFGDVPATLSGSATANILTVVVPALVGTADVTVVNPDGQQAVLTSAFFALPGSPPASPRPVVTTVSPSTGLVSGGAVVKVFGTGFQPGSKVSFGGVAASLSGSPTATILTVVVPALLVGSADVKIVNPDGQQARPARITG